MLSHFPHFLKSHSFVIFNGVVEVGGRKTSIFAKIFEFDDFLTFIGSELTNAELSAYHKMCKFSQKSEKITEKWG